MSRAIALKPKNGNGTIHTPVAPPIRSSKEEIDERRRQVARLRMRGLGYRAIAKLLSVGHMTIKRDLEAIREDNRRKATTLDRQEYAGESLTVYQEVELRAWQEYHAADEGSITRQKFLTEIRDARRDQTELLMNLGIIEKAPTESVIHVSTEVLSDWSPEAQDLVALAILKSRMKPLAEPQPDKLLESPAAVSEPIPDKTG